MVNNLIDEINSQMGGVFLTNGGETNPLAFDNWTLTSPGMPKITPSQDNPAEYDHVMFIVRNHENYNGSGYGSTGGFSKLLLGYKADTYSFQGSFDNIPLDVCRHELGHFLLGHNNFHCAGGGNSTNYWIPFTGGHSMLGMSGEALRCWNAWDRYRLGWDAPGSSYLIAARDASGNNFVNGDLDATNPSDAGVYVLRDFVETGDALRIKLPFLDPNTEYEQWLWLENHRGYTLNGNEFDTYHHQNSTSCVEPVQWGLTAAIQIDREGKTGSSIYGGYMDYIRGLSADGMWERDFATPGLDQCTQWNVHSPSEKIAPNPLTGWGDLDLYPTEVDGQPGLMQADQKLVFADKVSGVYEYKLFRNGHPRQMFRTGKNDKIGMATNPPSTNRMNVLGKDLPIGSMDVRTVYLNGISVKILAMQSDGSIKLEVKFDDVEVDNDVRWAAPQIVLNPIPTASGFSLIVNPGKTLTLDHGMAATRMNDPITFEGQQVYTSPTVMNVKAGAKINLEPGSEMVIDRRSTLILENASQLDIQAGAVLRVKREGALKLLDGAIINVEDGGKIIIEERDGTFARSKMMFDENARINLNGSGSILDVGGLVHIGDGAVFRLSTSTTAFKTNGKIILRGTADVEFTAGNDASIFIRGFQKSQEVIVNQKVAMEFPPNLTDFVIQDLRISQLYARRIVPPRSNGCNILFKNIMVSNSFGEYDHYGVWTYGQAQLSFVNCDFNSGARGIVANNLEWGNNLKIQNCSFNSCDVGVSTYGKGAIIQSSSFNNCAQSWLAINMSANSLLYNCNFEGGVQKNVDYSGYSALYVDQCDMDYGITGIHVNQAMAKIECTGISDQTYYAVSATQGASLIMDGTYGNNRFVGNPRTIHLEDADILVLDEGENDLRANMDGTQDVINGSMLCFGPVSIAADRNKWNNSGTAPTSSDYLIYRNCSPPVPLVLTDTSPMSLIGYCVVDAEPGLEMNEDSEAESSALQANFDEALELLRRADMLSEPFGISENEGEDDGFPVQSTSEFIDTEILGFDLMQMTLSDPNAYEELGELDYALGLNELLYSFGEFNALSSNQAIVSVSEMTDMGNVVIDILNMASTIYQSLNQTEMVFRTALKTAQVFRMMGAYDDALAQLNFASGYASGAEQTDLIIQTACYLNMEVSAFAGDISFDFPWQEMDCSGELVQPGTNFAGMESVKFENELVGYPNPTNGSVTIETSNAESLIMGIEVFDLYGRLLLRKNESGNDLNLSSLKNGMYLVVVRLDDGTSKRMNVLKN